MKSEYNAYLDLKQIAQNNQQTILSEFKKKARNIGINKRKEFENHLLELAQEMVDSNNRNAVYEVLVSLQSTWSQYQPEKGLLDKFWKALEAGSKKEAEENYKKLVKQGLDYIRKVKKESGELVPIIINDKYMLLQYNIREIILYSLQLEEQAKMAVPKNMAIVDLFAPHVDQFMECKIGDGSNVNEQIQKLWLLLKDKESRKYIISITIDAIRTPKKSINCMELMEQVTVSLEQYMKEEPRLSCFQNNRLLVTKESIYCQEKQKDWKPWYNAESGNKITATYSTGYGFWVGHSNGDVFILKKFHRTGVRNVFKGFPEAVRHIVRTGRFMILSGKYFFKILSYAGETILDALDAQSEIMQTAILNDDYILILTANGMLTARGIKQGNISWQINLGDIYEMMTVYGEFVYCARRDGEIKVFKVPDFALMASKLQNKHIHVDKLSCDLDPLAPVRYISDFIGRKEILSDIKSMYSTHFLFYGVPRVGKTSLINVLKDLTAEKARCCIVDMALVLKEANSFDTFEKDFITICLRQHFVKYSELSIKTGYRASRLMVETVKGTKSFCIIGMDNFEIPEHFGEEDLEKFSSFLRSLLIHPNVRLIITCNSRMKVRIKKYFEEFRDILNQRKLISKDISLFSEEEAKNALRKKFPIQQSLVDELYRYTGGFPHLIHLFDQWNIERKSIYEQSEVLAENYNNNICEYFRDLSLDAFLIIVTCLYGKNIGEKINYQTFSSKYPFWKNELSGVELKGILKEIGSYGSGLTVKDDTDGFKILITDNPRFFRGATVYIPWIKDFETLHRFSFSQNLEGAQKVVQTFIRITQSELETKNILVRIAKKFKDKFFVCKLTEKGQQTLKMPLTTFVVVPFKKWSKNLYLESFLDLNSTLQEFCRTVGSSAVENINQMFYILLFELHGVSKSRVKKDLEGLDRISIIDAALMKNIVLAETPKERASKYIFSQLSIKERSPYTTAGAVPDSLFFGRQLEMSLIRGLPENIGIFGTRTIGKTSLLRRLHRIFKDQKGWKVYDMDCSRIEGEESLLKNLAEKMDVTLEEIDDIDKFRRYVSKKAEAGGHRYLFLLDEVDRLVQYDMQHGEKIFKTFNRLCMETMPNNKSAARFILFGFQQMFEQMKNPLSRLYNFMVFLPLQALDAEGAMNLVTKPIEDIRVKWKNREDAKYLVDCCSRHPRLLQAACHALLSILDDKGKERDIIERTEVDSALNSAKFREICMRFYHDSGADKNNGNGNGAVKPKAKKKSFFGLLWGKNDYHTSGGNDAKKEFLNDLHRITILAAIRLLFEEGKEIFTINELHEELKSYGIDVTPNRMRNLLDRLCLSGNFRLREESTIIATKRAAKNVENAVENSEDFNNIASPPDVDNEGNENFPKFTYEFGVKIYPRLLVAQFGGLKKCEEEREKLIQKGEW